MTKQTSLADLGRRAVACKHWRWMPGMLARSGGRSLRCDAVDLGRPAKSGSETIGPMSADTWEYLIGTEPTVPDLSDPATLGCLLHLVREAWPDEWNEFMVPIFDGFSHWRVGCLDLQRLPGAPKLIVPVDLETMKPLVWAYSEAEALVVALEAAP